MDFKVAKRGVRELMKNTLVDLSVPCQQVMEAARYMSLNESGGFYRPLLLLAAAKGYSVPLENAYPFAAAIEFIHCASLIDDDMADKSDLRRQLPSCHKAFGKDIARLANTFLVQKAYGLIIEGNDYPLTIKQKILSRAYKAGIGMALGQERDITQQGLDTATDIIRMYEKKSGLLIGLALATGGIIGRSCPQDVDNLNHIGIKAGIGYQIIDDTLDELAPSDLTGKPQGQDKNKKTLLKLVGLEEVKKIKSEADAEVDRSFKNLHGDHSLLGDMLLHLRHKHDNRLQGIVTT